MAARPTQPFRADHVGSLLRPERVYQARGDAADRRISGPDLRRVEDDAIAEVVRMQEDVGLQAATDGEFRWASWHMDFIDQLHGIERASDAMTVHFRNAEGAIDFTPAALRVEQKVGLDHTIFADDFGYLQFVTTSATPKLTIPSPSMVHYRGGRASVNTAAYPDLDDFWTDLSAAYAAEVRALGELRCTYLQLDDTSLAYLNDPAQRPELADRGDDAEHQHLRYIRQINAAWAGKPAP